MNISYEQHSIHSCGKPFPNSPVKAYIHQTMMAIFIMYKSKGGIFEGLYISGDLFEVLNAPHSTLTTLSHNCQIFCGVFS